MNQGRYVFTQLVDFLPRKNFEWLVKKYDGNKFVKSFTCWNHLMVLLFGQLSNREGLRDLIVTITPFKSAFHHLGFGKNVSRSNLSKANEIREVKKFQEFGFASCLASLPLYIAKEHNIRVLLPLHRSWLCQCVHTKLLARTIACFRQAHSLPTPHS